LRRVNFLMMGITKPRSGSHRVQANCNAAGGLAALNSDLFVFQFSRRLLRFSGPLSSGKPLSRLGSTPSPYSKMNYEQIFCAVVSRTYGTIRHVKVGSRPPIFDIFCRATVRHSPGLSVDPMSADWSHLARCGISVVANGIVGDDFFDFSNLLIRDFRPNS